METSDIILIIIAHSTLFGVACYFIGAQKEIGALAGAFLGVILGTIGLIIVLCSSAKESLPIKLQKFKALFDSGMITETEYTNLKGRLFEQQ